MAERNAELAAEKESSALKKLQVAAGLLDRPKAERLDWMYVQSALSKPDEDRLMNTPVNAAKDQDLENMKKLQESTAGSLFLKSATKTTEDLLRKLREDPLFQIKRQEQAARASMMANPLVLARLSKKAVKAAKKEEKKAKKAAKKEKKAIKKAAKAEGGGKKKKKKKSSSSSSSSDSSTAPLPPGARQFAPSPDAGPRRTARRPASPPPAAAGRRPSSPPAAARRPSSPPAAAGRRPSSPPAAAGGARGQPEAQQLGPSGTMVSKREEYAALVAKRKEEALASRGAPRRMGEEEKRRRLEEMRADAAKHERSKDQRIALAEARDRAVEEMEKSMRQTSDQKYFREIREQAYMDSGATVADRLKNQRHRRQKNLNDPLERDG